MSRVLPPTPPTVPRDACSTCGHSPYDHMSGSPVYLMYHAGTTYVLRSVDPGNVERDVRSLYGRWGMESTDSTTVTTVEVPARRINKSAMHADHWTRWIDDGRRTAEELAVDPAIRISEQTICGRPVYGPAGGTD
ncbi:MAG: hypothetical protein OXK17_10160 [Thaumarchaeota archaeon]|nr:hypothetical protein [Nitrososphaerota archaeon]